MRTFALLFALVACSGSTPAPHPDAAPAAGSFGAPCTVVSNMSTECTSGVCTDSVNMAMTPLCSQLCTYPDSSTCPSGSMGQKCNMKGFCRP